VSPRHFKELLEIEAQAFPKSQYDLDTFWSLYFRYPNTFLVAESDRIDGYIIFGPDGHIISMAVTPERRRRGIGTRLINESAEHCRGKTLRLEVRVSNIGAQRFYQSLGFVSAGKTKGYYQDGEDGLVMERPP
jgi:ribosomal-protein-alanine N-acetyltransferase